MVKRTEPISPTEWKEEFASDAFISGLEACISTTRELNRETAFIINYQPFFDMFIYPHTINIGSRDTTDFNSPPHFERARLKYMKQTGKQLPTRYNAAWHQRMQALIENGKLQVVRDEFLRGKRWIETHVPLHVDYPESEDLSTRRAFLDKILSMNNYNYQSRYNGVAVHTHPANSECRPSYADLESLNEFRWDNHRIYETQKLRKSVTIKPRLSLVINPVSLIITYSGRSDTYPVMIFQEATPEPLPIATDFAYLELGFTQPVDGRHKGARISQRKLYLVSSLYNVLRGELLPEERRIKLEAGYCWGQLCRINL